MTGAARISGLIATVLLILVAVACNDTCNPLTDPSCNGNGDATGPRLAGPPWSEIEIPIPEGGWLTAIAGEGQTLVAGGRFGVIIRSTDGGATWFRVASPTDRPITSLVASGQTFVATTGIGRVMIRSTDAGQTWSQVDPPTESTVLDFWASGSSLLAVSDRDVARSTDSGSTWHVTFSESSGHSFSSIFRSNTTVLAVGRRLLRSPAGGQSGSWVDVSSPTDARLRDVWGASPLWIAVGGCGLIARSTDDGRTWRLITPFTSEDLNVVRAVGSNIVVAGGGCGGVASVGGELHISRDQGESWEPVDIGGNVRIRVDDMWADGSTVVMVGRRLGGTFMLRSTEGF